MIYEPYKYQKAGVDWILNHPYCALFWEMGLGKSVVTLTAIQQLMDDCEVHKTLVIAPKKVAETTWSTEATKWDHLQSMKVVKVMGTEKQRIQALSTDADVYVLGRDSFVWLFSYYNGFMPFDVVVLDELTSFKSAKSSRFKTMRMARPSIKRVIGLTGTPSPNGLVDLWAQIYCLDMGARLGKSVTRFKDTYFNIHTWNNIAVKCTVKKGCENIIRDKISDICMSMEAKDYLQLPKLMAHTERVYLSKKVKEAYEQFERDSVLEYRSEHDENEATNILATSAAGLMNKLCQFANGAVYDEEREVHEMHEEKIDRLMEIIEAANGSSVLVFYQYKHDIGRIMKRLKDYRARTYEGEKDLLDWNAGKIDVLLAHPASTAYGLNMQEGGHYIVWFGTGWNLEWYQQANARLHRQGQLYPVHVYRLVCAGTVDERACMALESKKNVQQNLMDNLRYLIDKYKEVEDVERKRV